MKKSFYFLIILFLCYSKIHADVGDPCIQGVCRITLYNGKIVEGFINIASGGYYGLWVNGLNTSDTVQGHRFNCQTFFDLDFRAIEFNDSSLDFHHVNPSFDRTSENISSAVGLIKGSYRISFLQWVENPSILLSYDPIVRKDTLIIIKHVERHYLILDTIKLYLDLTSTTFLDTIDLEQKPIKRIETINIPTSEIKKFELLTKPSKLWLDKIEEAKKTFPGTETGDWLPAYWFHEMIADTNEYNFYQPRILYWLDRSLR